MSTEDEVIALVAKKTGIPVNNITPDKTFFALGIDGDDAVEVVSAICDRYQVPTENINLNRYIGPEAGFGVITHIFNALTRKSSVEQKELRIADLIKTAEDHQWFDVPLHRSS